MSDRFTTIQEVAKRVGPGVFNRLAFSVAANRARTPDTQVPAPGVVQPALTPPDHAPLLQEQQVALGWLNDQLSDAAHLRSRDGEFVVLQPNTDQFITIDEFLQIPPPPEVPLSAPEWTALVRQWAEDKKEALPAPENTPIPQVFNWLDNNLAKGTYLQLGNDLMITARDGGVYTVDDFVDAYGPPDGINIGDQSWALVFRQWADTLRNKKLAEQPEPLPPAQLAPDANVPGPDVFAPVGATSPSPPPTPEQRAKIEAARIEREKDDAKDEIERLRSKLNGLREKRLEVLEDISMFLKPGGREFSEEYNLQTAPTYVNLASELASLDLEMVSPLPEHEWVAGEIAKGSKGEIKKIEEALEKAKLEYKTEFGEDFGDEPVYQDPVAIVDSIPTPDEEYLTRWERSTDLAVSVGKALPRVAGAVAMTLLGVRLVSTGFTFAKERRQAGELETMINEFNEAAKKAAAAAVPEKDKADEEEKKKLEALTELINKLEKEGYLTVKSKEQLLQSITEINTQWKTQAGEVEKQLKKEVERAVSDYFHRKASGLELAKQAVNFASIGVAWQFGRAITYGGMSLYQKAVRERQEYERSLPLKDRDKAKLWDTARDTRVLESIFKEALAEHAKDSTGTFWDIIKNKKTKKSEWSRKKMSQVKALGGVAIGASMLGLSISETVSGVSGEGIGATLENSLRSASGNWLGFVTNNYLHLDAISRGYHKVFGGDETKVTDSLGVPKHEEPVVPVRSAHPVEAAKIPAENQAYQRLEDHFRDGRVDFQTKPDGTSQLVVEVGKGGYTHLQQALRDIVVQESQIRGGFDLLDGTRVENIVANLKLMLEDHQDLRLVEWGTHGEKIFTHLHASDLGKVASFEHGQLVIKDMDGFRAFLNNDSNGLITHALRKITDGNLARYHEVSSAAARTSEHHWQQDVDVKTGTTDPNNADYVKVDFDHEAVHTANVATADAHVAALGAPGAEVIHETVKWGDTYSIKVDDDIVYVKDGVIDTIATKTGYMFQTPEIRIDDLYAGDTLSRAIETVQFWSLVGMITGAELIQRSDFEKRKRAEVIYKPTTFKEIITSKDSGGLVEDDGRVHFGEVLFEPKWLEQIAGRSLDRFVKNPVPGFMDKFDVSKSRALKALAKFIKDNPDAKVPNVGEYIVLHQDELKRSLKSTI